MLTSIRAARAEFYARTGRLPERLLLRPEAYRSVMNEASHGELSMGWMDGEVTLCGMTVEETPGLKSSFEVK